MSHDPGRADWLTLNPKALVGVGPSSWEWSRLPGCWAKIGVNGSCRWKFKKIIFIPVLVNTHKSYTCTYNYIKYDDTCTNVHITYITLVFIHVKGTFLPTKHTQGVTFHIVRNMHKYHNAYKCTSSGLGFGVVAFFFTFTGVRLSGVPSRSLVGSALSLFDSSPSSPRLAPSIPTGTGVLCPWQSPGIW